MNIALTVTDVAKVKGIVTAVSDNEFRLRWQNFRQMSKLFKIFQLPPSLGILNWNYLYIVYFYQSRRVSYKMNSDHSMPVSEEVLLKSAEKTKTAREKKNLNKKASWQLLMSFNIIRPSIFQELLFFSPERELRQSILSNKTSLTKCKNSLFKKFNTTRIFVEMTWFFSRIFNSCYIYV